MVPGRWEDTLADAPASGAGTEVNSPKFRRGCHWAFVAALGACVPAPEVLTVGWTSELTRDLFAVGLVIPADFTGGRADAFADMRAPCLELVIGCGG